MDSRAKQRLTGAVILVALFVLLVPELLTGPHDGAKDAPAEDGMRQYTIDLDSPTSSVRPAQAPAVELPAVAPENDSRATPGEEAKPADAPAPTSVAVTPTPAAAAPSVSTPEPKPVAPAPVVAKNPVPSSATPPAAAPRVETPHVEAPRPEAPKPAPAATSAKPAAGSFAVQLGSFVSKENADGLVKEMTAKGFNAFLAPPITTGGRTLYRVRVGPTRDRAAAEALATQLRRIGRDGSVVPIT